MFGTREIGIYIDEACLVHALEGVHHQATCASDLDSPRKGCVHAVQQPSG